MFSFTWEGLEDRTLRSRNTAKERETWFDQTGKTCHQQFVTSPCKEVPIKDIATGLPEIVEEITEPLYKSFNYKLPLEEIRGEILKMLK